jgi:hypothetical protein
MPRITNILTGKDAGYVTNEQWEAMKGDRRYNKVFKAQPGLDDLPEVQALDKEIKEAAKVERRTRKKTATPQTEDTDAGESLPDNENAES